MSFSAAFFIAIKIALSVGSSLSILPALGLIWQRGLHFELFVGVFQLFASIVYGVLDSTGLPRFIFLSALQAHQISDILTETYVALLALHLWGLKSAEVLVALRYVAFASLWIAKLGDDWDAVLLEGVVLGVYLLPALALGAQGAATHVPGWKGASLFSWVPIPAARVFLERRLPYKAAVAPLAVGAALAGVVLFILEQFADSELRVFNALAHAALAAAAYHCWGLLPSMEKSDVLPSFR
jgi:hypothetical protein